MSLKQLHEVIDETIALGNKVYIETYKRHSVYIRKRGPHNILVTTCKSGGALMLITMSEIKSVYLAQGVDKGKIIPYYLFRAENKIVSWTSSAPKNKPGCTKNLYII